MSAELTGKTNIGNISSDVNVNVNVNVVVADVGISEEMSVDGGTMTMTMTNKTKKGTNTSRPSSTRTSIIKFASLFSGGTFFDAILMESAQQIGQSILTLPWIFANMGFSLGKSSSQ
jgi:hypothetical protein